MVASGLRLQRGHDLAEVHRLIHGGWQAGPDLVWAGAHGIPAERLPRPHADDLFSSPSTSSDLITPDGVLRADAVSGDWLSTPERLVAWAQAARECAARQEESLRQHTPAARVSAAAESAAALLCVELEHDGLPIDRAALSR